MAGESSRREYGRLRADRTERMRQRRRVVLAFASGASVVALILTGDLAVAVGAFVMVAAHLVMPSSPEAAWRRRARSQEAMGRVLDALPGSRALHDRRMPTSSGIISHVLVASTGVWTIDATHASGAITVRADGQQLWIANRDQSELLGRAHLQAEAVRGALVAAGHTGIEVRPALCLLGVTWSPRRRPSSAAGVRLLPRGDVAGLVTGTDQLADDQVVRVVEALDRRLRPATAVAAPSTQDLAGPRPPDRGADADVEAEEPDAETEQPDAAGRDSPADAGVSAADARQPDADAGVSAADARQPDAGADADADADETVVVTESRRDGHHRLQVRRASGEDLGYVDLRSNAVVPTLERHRRVVAEAAAQHLRDT